MSGGMSWGLVGYEWGHEWGIGGGLIEDMSGGLSGDMSGGALALVEGLSFMGSGRVSHLQLMGQWFQSD